MEDLILHDTARDIRSPSHALTIARDALQTRRRIAAQSSDWALSPTGLRSLRQARPVAPFGDGGIIADKASTALPDPAFDRYGRDGEGRQNRLDCGLDLPGIDLDAIEAVLARSADVLARVKQPRQLAKPETDPLIRDHDWDEEEWLTVLPSVWDLPPGLWAILALDAWNELAVLQRAPSLDSLLAASLLRREGLISHAHLLAFKAGLKTICVERRRHRSFSSKSLRTEKVILQTFQPPIRRKSNNNRREMYGSAASDNFARHNARHLSEGIY